MVPKSEVQVKQKVKSLGAPNKTKKTEQLKQDLNIVNTLN